MSADHRYLTDNHVSANIDKVNSKTNMYKEPSTQLKGTLVRQHEAMHPSQSEGLAALATLGVSVEQGEDSTVTALGPAEVATDIVLDGLVHISRGSIDQFHRDKVGPNGKFGLGTYFAAGELTGETYDLLATHGSTVHAAKSKGTAMIVDRDKVKELEGFLKEQAGLPQSGLKTRIPNADITGLAPEGVDMLVVFMDRERSAAEIVIFPHAVGEIEVTDRRVIE